MRTVRDAMNEKKNIFRITTITGNQPQFIIAEKVNILDGFLHIMKSDFVYTLENMRDGKKVSTTCSGDFAQYHKCLNRDCVLAYEEVEAEDSRYATFTEIIDRTIAAKCNIALPPDKQIIIAQS